VSMNLTYTMIPALNFDSIMSHPVFRSKLNALLYVCQDQVSHIKRRLVEQTT
jgi:hypothetical protein